MLPQNYAFSQMHNDILGTILGMQKKLDKIAALVKEMKNIGATICSQVWMEAGNEQHL